MAGSLVHTRFTPRRAPGRLDHDSIHVWGARLNLPVATVQRLEACLTPEERKRSAHRRHSRAVLRHLLAGYVEVDPADLRLVGETDRKPSLLDQPGDEELHFNLSHSADLLLVAIGRTSRLGVDVERVRPVRRADTIARRAFSARERSRIRDLPPESRPAAFFNCWTRKEACVKALGHGVWSAFGRWEVSVEPDEPARVLVADGDTEAASDWSLFHLEPAPGFVGALAVHGTGWSVEAWSLDRRE